MSVSAHESDSDMTLYELPSALDRYQGLMPQLGNRRLAVFLDYDGTLTPIVARPDLAKLSEDMRGVVGDLSQYCPVAIISGRDRANVQQLVDLESIVYAGSHGFDIAGPHGLHLQLDEALALLPVVDRVETNLQQRLAAIPGSLVERKRFSIAVHVRQVVDRQVTVVEDIVDQMVSRYPALRKGRGKKVFELQPDIDWHKGKAVLWLLQALHLDTPRVVPIYIGDDRTDEDAFQALNGRGWGIVVTESVRPTAAQFTLQHTIEVKILLQQLLGYAISTHSASTDV
ncbi:Trehalose-phosphate phosphatase [Candidatus Entotheonellaceae bacterium PAL068K]